MITNDKRMDFQQRLLRRPFAVLILSATNWPVIEPHVQKIAEALEHSKPGTVTRVECGRFRPMRFQKPSV